MRIKRGVHHVKRRHNILKQTKGFRYGRKSEIVAAMEALKHAGKHARAGRRIKKRDFRTLWNVQINAASREHNLSYNRLIGGLKKKNIGLNRKSLSELSIKHPEIFRQLVETVSK